ncbi:MAG: glycosyltransferase [Pseudohongiellaceae bacterium]
MSSVVTDFLTGSGEAPSNKVVKISSPVQLPDVGEIDASEPHLFRIGFVGRLENVKNPCVLIDALSKLRAENIDAEVHFVGEGKQRAMLIDRARRLGVSEYTHFHGYQRDPFKFVHKCHVFVQPSYTEGFSIALVEAMSCGLPVIATTTGNAVDVVNPGVNGWLIKSPDEKPLTEALFEAWKLGPETLRNMGLKARESIKNRFSPTEYVQKLELLYLEVKTAKFGK